MLKAVPHNQSLAIFNSGVTVFCLRSNAEQSLADSSVVSQGFCKILLTLSKYFKIKPVPGCCSQEKFLLDKLKGERELILKFFPLYQETTQKFNS